MRSSRSTRKRCEAQRRVRADTPRRNAANPAGDFHTRSLDRCDSHAILCCLYPLQAVLSSLSALRHSTRAGRLIFVERANASSPGRPLRPTCHSLAHPQAIRQIRAFEEEAQASGARRRRRRLV
eukprot:4844909-Pleurochrysis_carterae.AAC.1